MIIIKKYIILLVSIILLSLYIFNYKNYENNKNIYYSVSKINTIDDEHKNKINIYFPITNYNLLDKEINNIVDTYVKEFKDAINEYKIQENLYYTLYINYDEYTYKNYISFVFNIEMFTGGAHPNHFITTINYDTLNNKFINIDSLINLNKNILNDLSKESRNILSSDKKFQINYNKDMMYEGTLPNKENFKNFVLTENGLKILFNYYQIAPYYYGETIINIEYEKLNIEF